MSEVQSENRKIDPELNEEQIEVEFEDEHFHAGETINDDYRLLVEQSRLKHKYWLSEYALKRVRMNQNYILLIVGGVGCQTKGSKVLMANGTLKNIEEIQIGDEVISPQHDGNRMISKILELKEFYSNTCFDIRNPLNRKDIYYTCSYNHLIPHINKKTWTLTHSQAEDLWGKEIFTLNSDMDIVKAKVSPRHSGDVYGFSLDSPSQWYITDNNMITHNTGKSYSAMGLAQDIDPYFNVDRIIFHPKDFISLLEMGLPKGSVIMWEEVGVSLSSRDWYKEQNKIISSLFETFRRHNLILIMTVPFVKFIDSRIRSMIHGFAEMIDPTFSGGKFGWLKYFHVIVEQRTGKIRHRYPRIRDEEGKIQIIQGASNESGNMHFNLPSKELLELYEKKKFDFVQWQQKSGLEAFDQKKKAPSLEIEDFIKVLTSNPRKYKLIQSEAEKDSLTNIIEHCWVLIRLDYADHKMQKKDMISALRFVLSSYDYTFKGRSKSIGDDEIGTVVKLMQLVGDNKNQIAKMLNTSNHTITKKINEWQKSGVWDEWVANLNKDNETDDEKESDDEKSEELDHPEQPDEMREEQDIEKGCDVDEE